MFNDSKRVLIGNRVTDDFHVKVIGECIVKSVRSDEVRCIVPSGFEPVDGYPTKDERYAGVKSYLGVDDLQFAIRPRNLEMTR